MRGHGAELDSTLTPSIEPQVYTGGEACDITGKQRETDVHYVCSEEGKEGIKSIREHATCQYTLVFATPRLCKHPGFQTPKQPVHTIVCSRQGGSWHQGSEVSAQPLDLGHQAAGEKLSASPPQGPHISSNSHCTSLVPAGSCCLDSLSS